MTGLVLLLALVRTPWAQNPGAAAALPVEYYGEIGCSHCDTFKDVELPEAEKATGVVVALEMVDILSTEGYERCAKRLAGLGYDFTVFPVLVIGNNAYQGNAAIEANLVPELAFFAQHGSPRPRTDPPVAATGPDGPAGRAGMRWAILPIVGAGLVDGINPCAFTTLLFFLSYLSLRGKTWRRMALAGVTFAAGVFLAYFLIGLGLFNAFRIGGQLSALKLALRVVVSAITAGFFALTIRDVLLMKRGVAFDMALKLPDALRTRINASIRGGLGPTAFFSGVFFTGMVVSVLELACTGQVYFPTISFMAQTDASFLGIGSLLLYNLAFVTPLLVVLALMLSGMRQEAIRAFFARRLVASKLFLAVVFAALSVLVWIY